MTYLTVLGLYFAGLFLLAFFSRRRMGVPTLALAAGAYLATLWTDSLTPVVAEAGLEIVRPPLASIVAITLTLLPALIVMVRAPKRTKHHHGIIGGLIFAALGTMITYGAFSNAVVMDDGSVEIVKQLLSYQAWVITACIAIAVLEILLMKNTHRDHRKRD